MPKVREKLSAAALVLAIVLIIFGVTLIVLGILGISGFGWYSLLLILAGLITAGLAIMAIATGKSAWLLVDLLLPG